MRFISLHHNWEPKSEKYCKKHSGYQTSNNNTVKYGQTLIDTLHIIFHHEETAYRPHIDSNAFG
jgi:hypothetical protein